MGSQYSPRSQTKGMHYCVLLDLKLQLLEKAYEKHLKVQA